MRNFVPLKPMKSAEQFNELCNEFLKDEHDVDGHIDRYFYRWTRELIIVIRNDYEFDAVIVAALKFFISVARQSFALKLPPDMLAQELAFDAGDEGSWFPEDKIIKPHQTLFYRPFLGDMDDDEVYTQLELMNSEHFIEEAGEALKALYLYHWCTEILENLESPESLFSSAFESAACIMLQTLADIYLASMPAEYRCPEQIRMDRAANRPGG